MQVCLFNKFTSRGNYYFFNFVLNTIIYRLYYLYAVPTNCVYSALLIDTYQCGRLVEVS